MLYKFGPCASCVISMARFQIPPYAHAGENVCTCAVVAAAAAATVVAVAVVFFVGVVGGGGGVCVCVLVTSRPDTDPGKCSRHARA